MAKNNAIDLDIVTGGGHTITFPTADTTLVGRDTTDTLTNKDLTSGTNTFPTFNQNTTGSSAKWTTARLLAGNSVDGSANVAFANKFIVQGTTDTGLSGAQFLGSLGTGILKNTTTTGVLSIAVAGDFPTLNQNTTGSAATLTTTRTIWGQNFNGSANVTGTLALGTSSLTLTGSIGATGARATKVWTVDLESTNMPTVGGTAILTSLTAPQFTTIELGNATDTTLSRSAAGVLAVEGVVIPSISSTNTLTNKKIDNRVQTQTSTSTLTFDRNSYDTSFLTAQAAALTIANSSNTNVGDSWSINILDNGTARALTFGTDYVGISGQALPTTTTISKWMNIIFTKVTSSKTIVSYVNEA